MHDFWNNRFLTEKEIWGIKHSKTAELCLKFFSKYQINSILIPGCGYGRNAKYFIDNKLKVEGVEISEEAIKIAEAKGIFFKIYQGSILEMPFNDSIYDGIYCFNVLHLLLEKDRFSFIDKCFNQIKNNGLVYFAAFSEQDPSFGKGKEVEKNTFESRPGRPAHYFTDGDLRNHFDKYLILESGIIEDYENHGEEGHHTHLLRYIIIQKKIIETADNSVLPI
ncbi:MAG: hypothetical protein A2Y41_04760 [Spirochaetes bacterium GWB1_36_13]|nr:MAG: hypothetical protein A2Y41_04760 [Spirochaetes bacterium GWB1_36_13]